MSVQDRWNTIEDAAAALVNKARLRKGMADTNQEWEFLLAAALALALESYELGVAAGLEQIAPTGTATRAITRWEHDPIAVGRAEIERLAQGEPAADDDKC